MRAIPIGRIPVRPKLDVQKSAILCGLPLLVMAVPWLWTSWVWTYNRMHDPSLTRTLTDGSFFSTDMVALYLAAFLFAYTLTTVRLSYGPDLLVLVCCCLSAMLIATAFDVGWFAKGGPRFYDLIREIFPDAAPRKFPVTGKLSEPLVFPLVIGIAAGGLVYLASRWLTKRPIFGRGWWAEFLVHAFAFTVAIYLARFGLGDEFGDQGVYGEEWAQDRLFRLRSGDAEILDYAITFLPKFFLIPLVHLSSLLLYRMLAGWPEGSARSLRTLALASIAVFLATGTNLGLRDNRPDLILGWPTHVGWEARHWLTYPKREPQETVAGYRLNLPRSRVQPIWDRFFGRFEGFHIRYPKSETPEQIRGGVDVRIAPLPTKNPVKRIYCDEVFQPGLTLCDEAAPGDGDHTSHLVRSEWLLQKSHIVVPDTRSDIVIGRRGARGSVIDDYPSTISIIYTADVHPGISLKITAWRTEIEDWPFLVAVLDDFVERYLIPPAD